MKLTPTNGRIFGKAVWSELGFSVQCSGFEVQIRLDVGQVVPDVTGYGLPTVNFNLQKN